MCLSLKDPWLRASPLRPPARLILSTAASRAAPIESSFNRPFDPLPACFTVRLFSPLASSQIPAPGTTVTETQLLEVRPAKVGPRNFVSISISPGSRGTISVGLSIPTWTSNALSLPSGDQGVARTWSMLSASHLSDLGTLLMFADLVLIAIPCSVTTTASDDEFSMPTNTLGRTFFLSLVWWACTGSCLQTPGSVCCPFAHAACAAVSSVCRCRTCS